MPFNNRRYSHRRTQVMQLMLASYTLPTSLVSYSEKPAHQALGFTLPSYHYKPSFFARQLGLGGDHDRRTKTPTQLCSAKHSEARTMKNSSHLTPEAGGRTMLEYIQASKGLLDKPIRSKHQGTRKKASKRKGN